ncbi:wax ester/triacylglycerol synthase domain-containing protein [Streptomyces sp. NPDC049590]|uniref:wax ester/triacylglycerol synthase domain-containing protein n=1 Tax=Streptomyces sp. NPDC049590 TaxID=3154834 RepID=UPI003448FD4B
MTAPEEEHTVQDETPRTAPGDDRWPVGGWTSPGPMNGTDTFFWRMGANPLTRPHVTWAWFLDKPPDRSAFLDGCRWIVGKLPRLTHRVADTPLRVGTPVWEPDPDFRLTRHVHRMRLPDPAGPRELLDLIEWRNSTDFDPLHPPWEATVVEGYERERAAIVLKWHHSVGDAVTIVAALSRLLPQSARVNLPDSLPHFGEGKARVPAAAARLFPASAAHGVTEGTRAALWETVRALSSPGDAKDSGRRVARSLVQMMQPVRPSPLLRRRSPAIRCGMATVPLAGLKAAGKAVGASVTAAYVSAVLGAFHRYHDHHGSSHRSLPTLVPVNIRTPYEYGAGNIVAAVRVAGPIGDMPSPARTAAVHTAIAEARETLVRGFYTTLVDLGSGLPGLVHRWLVPPVLKSVDIVVTSVPGFSRTTYSADARVLGTVPWAPRGGAAANISMSSHNGTCTIGTNLDPAAITDTDLFHHCLEQSLQETITL